MIMHGPLFTPPFLAPWLMVLACASAQAQGVYRIVGPDGKVTFSDRPAADAPAQQTMRSLAPADADPSANAALPYELRQISTRFPVTLYTGSDCTPCDGARNILLTRGVPFTERTVSSNEDIEALQRLSGSTNLPFGTIGGQRLAGFSDGDWTQYLDAAGYPKQSQLPGNYRRPTPSPLVAAKPVEPASAAAKPPAQSARKEQRTPPPVNEAPTTPSNPAGIRF
nr:glutaredoxin family protein [Verminephrobacter aporrectodeae]